MGECVIERLVHMALAFQLSEEEVKYVHRDGGTCNGPSAGED